jgi:hypothetical protein
MPYIKELRALTTEPLPSALETVRARQMSTWLAHLERRFERLRT